MDIKLSTVLLIEDNELNQQMLSKRLEKNGFFVIHRENGLQLLDVVERTQPDIILMDMLLPDIDGWNLAQTLKADPRTAWIPLIAVTALAMPGDREKCLRAGCDAYISKPVNFPLLLSTMQELYESLDPTRHALGRSGQMSS